jgi:hypothetical protein
MEQTRQSARANIADVCLPIPYPSPMHSNRVPGFSIVIHVLLDLLTPRSPSSALFETYCERRDFYSPTFRHILVHISLIASVPVPCLAFRRSLAIHHPVTTRHDRFPLGARNVSCSLVCIWRIADMAPSPLLVIRDHGLCS